MIRVACCLLALSFAPLAAAAETDRTVAAVNAPLAHIARVLGGADIEVIYPVPAGIDPAFWEPSEDAILQVQSADLILLNGAGYAGWTDTAVLPRSRLVNTTGDVEDLLIPADDQPVAHKHGPEGEHVHGGRYQITTWLDPVIAAAQVETAAAAMSRRWPDMEMAVGERAGTLLEDIDTMGAALGNFADGLDARQVFASHPVYGYFDRAFLGGLTSLHWEPDAVPPEDEWSALAEMLDPGRAPVMIWEASPLPETAERLRALGVEVVVLSPMGNGDSTKRIFLEIARQVDGAPG